MSVVHMRCTLRISIKIMLNISETTLSICNLIFYHINHNYFTSFPVLICTPFFVQAVNILITLVYYYAKTLRFTLVKALTNNIMKCKIASLNRLPPQYVG